MNRFIDTHCHLLFPELLNDLEGVLTRAKEVGIDRFVMPATTVEDSTSGVEFSQKHPGTFASVGIHPMHVDEYNDEDIEKLKSLLESNKSIVSIGEVGLDYYHFEGLDEQGIALRKERQASVFKSMVELATQYNKPLILHTRECYEDASRQLHTNAPGHTAVVHCFTGSLEEAKGWLDLGCHISFTGIITYKRNDALREVVKVVPLEKMMLETDAPFLAPEGFRGQRGEPRFVRNVAQCVAAVKGISVEEVAERTTATAEAFFGI